MNTVGAFEAKTHLAALLDRVGKGEKITITRHGIPAALLVPVGENITRLSHGEIVEGMRALRTRVKSGKMAVKEMVDEGAPVLSGVVIDASTALAWCFPDETSEYADKVLVALEGHTVLVPAVWSLEIANALLVGQRKKRLNQLEIKNFITLLGNLSVVQEVQSAAEHITNVLPLARAHDLSAYDAAYLELSIRRAAPLATLDNRLLKAAKQSGVKNFKGTAEKQAE